MDFTFTVTNTTSSDVDLKIDGETIQSHFVFQGDKVTFTLTDRQINKASLITIENSDIVYDVTESCKQKVANYVKPTVKLDTVIITEPTMGEKLEGIPTPKKDIPSLKRSSVFGSDIGKPTNIMSSESEEKPTPRISSDPFDFDFDDD